MVSKIFIPPSFGLIPKLCPQTSPDQTAIRLNCWNFQPSCHGRRGDFAPYVVKGNAKKYRLRGHFAHTPGLCNRFHGLRGSLERSEIGVSRRRPLYFEASRPIGTTPNNGPIRWITARNPRVHWGRACSRDDRRARPLAPRSVSPAPKTNVRR